MSRNIPKQLQNWLVLWLDSNGKDLSGNWNNGTLVNSPTKVRVLQNDGLSYNGSTQYINTNFSALSTNSFTLNTWFKTSTAQVNGLLFWTYSASTTVFFWQDTNWDWLHKLSFYLRDSNGVQTAQDSTCNSNVMNDGKYHMATLSVNRSDNIVTQYFDWVLTNTISKTFTWNFTNWYTRLVWWYNWSGWQLPDYTWYCINPMIWNRALSQTEIEMLYISTFIK